MTSRRYFLRSALLSVYGASMLMSDNIFSQSADEQSARKPLVEFSFSMHDEQNRDVFELEEGQTNTLVLIANKPVETRLPTVGIDWTFGQSPMKSVRFQGIFPKFGGEHYGKTNDWFYPHPMALNDIFTESAARGTKRLRDDNGNYLPWKGPKSGKNAFAYYRIFQANTQVEPTSINQNERVQPVIINYKYVSPQDSTTSTEPNRVTPLHIALIPSKRPQYSLLLHNILTDGTPSPCATGCVDEKDKPRTMVLQRSFGDMMGPWANVYTNSITAENPYGSISYVDAEAKGKSAFYRVVSPSTARQTGVSLANIVPSLLEKKAEQ